MKRIFYCLLMMIIFCSSIHLQAHLKDSIQYDFDKTIPSLMIFSEQNGINLKGVKTSSENFLKQTINLDENVTISLLNSEIDLRGNIHESPRWREFPNPCRTNLLLRATYGLEIHASLGMQTETIKSP